MGVTFLLYREAQGGTPLWMETQNVTPERNGRYTVMLGASKPEGLPAELFESGKARWLAVQVVGQAEEPRVLLVAVPYALKAADAATLGGIPASAFMLATPASTESVSINVAPVLSSATTASGNSPTTTITGAGTTSYVPLWTGTSSVGNSALFQTGSGSTARIGINTTVPTSTLDVKGAASFRGAINMAATGIATPAAGRVSQAQNFAASAYNTATSTAVNEVFHWRAEPVGNNTSHTSGSMNLLFAQGSATPSETGFAIASNGQVSFASGQKFPGAGTITGFTAGTDLTGGGTTGIVTLNLDTTKVPQLSADNVFTGNQTMNSATSAPTLTLNQLALGAHALVTTGGPNATGIVGYGGPGASNYDGGDAIDLNGGSGSSGGTAIFAVGGSGSAVQGGYGIVAYAGLEPNLTRINAAYFGGNVTVSGSLSKAGGSFKIDHPLDPANKYLYHSFVESPDMMNIYNGNVTTDGEGNAVVNLPDWFETLNRDFRYQLTVVGQFAQAIVASKVANHCFAIKTDKPNVEVSWQVTGIRQDAWANAHRIPVEEVKTEKERGHYLHPELFHQPAEKSVDWAERPAMMRTMAEHSR
jgi:hypothetical protein